MSARPLPADNPASDEEGDHEGSADILSDEEQSAEKDITKNKPLQSTMKNVWLVTYGARNPYITPEMLHTFFSTRILKTKNEVDGCPRAYEVKECHSTKNSIMSVTYLHLTDRFRIASIENFMEEAKKKHGIVLNSVSGHASIASSSQEKTATPIQEHIGFKMLLKHYIDKNPAFKPWTDGEPVLKRGDIFKAAKDKPEKQPHRAKKQSVSMVNEKLRAENTKLLTKYAALKTKNAALETDKAALEAKTTALETETTAQKTEIAAHKRKIQELEGTEALRTENAAQKREIQELKRAR